MSRTPKRVIVVEDNALDAELLLLELSKAGFTITLMDSAEAALEQLNSDCSQYDIAMVNLKLPGMGGLELIRLIKAKCPLMPICVVTGDRDQVLWQDAIDAGAMILFPKPYNSVSNLVILGILREVYRAANRVLISPVTSARLSLPPKLTPSTWRRNLYSAFVGGAAGAFGSGLAITLVAPDKFNIGEGLVRTIVAVCITALITGAKGFFDYLHTNPLPPDDERTPTG